MQIWKISGVPTRLAQDGWWLGADSGKLSENPQRLPNGSIAVVGLIALGDWLFWQQAGPGLSLALFMLALAMVLRGGVRRGLHISDVVLVFALAPLVERVQLLSISFAVLGVVGYAIHQFAGVGLGRVLAALPRVVMQILPMQALKTVPDGLTSAVSQVRLLLAKGGSATVVARALALPVGLGLCFGVLLVLANPILADLVADLLQWNIDFLRMILRGLFWAGLATVICPLLALAEMDQTPGRGVLPDFSLPYFAGIVNAEAVCLSLWLFNAMFAVQTCLDIAFLWGSAVLPAGVSHAEYAQRGAYPLVVTALLSGAFALLSRPFAAENRILRALLLAWVSQNVALVISALYRLETYVSAYGLTYLRAYAAIWMAMVTVGLMLVAWQVLCGLPNGWLMLRSAVLGGGVLYGCCFVNFAGGIADYNLTAMRDGRLHYGLDRRQICGGFGPDAWAALVKHVAAGYSLDCDGTRDSFEIGWVDVTPPHIEGWRDWSFRSWRILKGADFANTDRG